MCPSNTDQEAGNHTVTQQEALIKTRLNPAAVEFSAHSSSSQSSGSPPGRELDQLRCTPDSVLMEAANNAKTSRGEYIMPSGTAGQMPRSSSGGSRSAASPPAHGWEPPAMMRASPPPIEHMIPPTRQLSILLGKDEEEDVVQELLERHGELRHFDTSKRDSHGVVTATFYDIRSAIAAFDVLPTAPPLPLGPPRLVRFVPLGGAGGPGSAPSENDHAQQESTGILAVEVEEGELGREGLVQACSAHGEVCGIWGSGQLYFVEYMDTRSAERAMEELASQPPAGCKLAVRYADLDPIVLLGRAPSVAQVAATMRGGSPHPLSRNSSFGRSASPPLILHAGSPPPVVVPVMPAYSWGAAYPVFHMYPPDVAAGLERAASPPAVYPNGGSPPLPSGFISVPVRTSSGPLYGTSPPYAGAAIYGTSPPSMGSSPPGAVMLMAPSLPMFDASGQPMMMAAPGGMGGYPMQGPSADMMHRMSGMSLGRQQQQQGQQQQQEGTPKAQRSDTRASARIARSHRAGGAYNPSEFEFSLEEAEGGRPGARTTVMIRNIPNKYTQAVMLDVLDKSGFSGQFDFFYLPIDFRNKCNLGYAFLNFTTPQAAARLYRLYHGKRWEEYNSRKVCELSYARVQGRDPLIEHFRASKFPSEDLEFMPLVYTQGDDGLATNPRSIHQFLADLDASKTAAGGSSSGGSDNGGGAGTGAASPTTQQGKAILSSVAEA